MNLAKCKKRTAKKIRRAIKQQLQYIRRDMGYVEAFLSDGVELTSKQAARLSVLRQVYEQQQYMYENNTHTVVDRIVYSGDECSPYSGSFLASNFDEAIFKVQPDFILLYIQNRHSKMLVTY